jgi:hypothetical protein
MSVFYTGGATFSSKYLFNYPHKAEWATSQTHYCTENIIVLGVDIVASGSVAKLLAYKLLKKLGTCYMRQQIAYSQNALKRVQITADDHKCALVCD